jgi:hypothetical protein
VKSAWAKWLSLGAAGVVLVALFYSRSRLAANPEAVCASTSKWGSTGTLRIRTESADSDTLLFHLVLGTYDRDNLRAGPDQDVDAIYRYRPGQQELEAIDRSAWELARGGISACIPREIGPPTHLSDGFDQDFVLRFDNRVIPTAGKGVVTTNLSPDDQLAAVVSSEVPQTRGMPFHGRPSGQFYHEYFRVRDGVQVGQTLRLPKLSRGPDQVLQSCWSADSRYLVYADDHHSQLCVIEAPRSGGS